MAIRATVAPVVRYGAQYRHFSRSINVFLTSAFIYALGIQIATLFTNFYLQALQRDAAFIGLYNAIPSAMTVLLALPVGVLSDRIGPRRGILIGMALQTLGLGALALSDGADALLGAIAVQGAGSAFLLTNGGPFLMAHTRPAQRNAAFSLQAVVSNATGFVGNLLAGYVPLGIALALGVGSESVPALRGALWAAVALTALAGLSMLRIPRQHAPEVLDAADCRTPELAATADCREQRGALVVTGAAPARPAEDGSAPAHKRLFSNPGLVARLVVPGTLMGLGAGMNIPVLNLFVQTRFGVGYHELGLVFALAAVGTMVATLLQPLLAARVGRVRSTLLVQALSLPFLLILGFVPLFPLVVVALMIRGALMNMGNPIFSAFAMEQIPTGERARFSSLNAMLWSGGWALGSSFAGWWRGVAGFDAGFNTTFALMTLCYVASFVLLWWWFDRAEATARQASRTLDAPAGA